MPPRNKANSKAAGSTDPASITEGVEKAPSTSKRASSRKKAVGEPVGQQSGGQQPWTLLVDAPNSITPEEDTIIMRLDINMDSSEPHLDVPPDPYNITMLDRHTAFGSQPAIAEVSGDLQASTHVISSSSTKSNVMVSGSDSRIIRLLTEFQEKSKSGDWPLNTNVHCYWCCHRFDTPPLGLPVRYIGDRFHVIGCFCSLQCASAYNFDKKTIMGIDECMIRHSLLNSLSVKLGWPSVVRPAPDRLVLKMFGGHMSIEEFRAYTSNSSNHLIVNHPPMHCITQYIEEISDHDIQSEYKYIPVDIDRISRYQEKLRLSRSKPLPSSKSTLEQAMNIRISKKDT